MTVSAADAPPDAPGRLARPAVAVAAALAAFCSLSTVVLTGRATERLIVLPWDPLSTVLPLAAGTLAVLLPGRVSRAPLWLLAIVFLPWLPIPVPLAFLTWSGPVLAFVWIGVAVAVLADLGVRPRLRPSAALAGVLAFVVFAAAAWRTGPTRPGGDEPHYLVITQSLLYDHDLRIDNNHARGDYHAYYGGDLRPDFLVRGRDGGVYSIHAPGLSLLVAPVFAVAGYRGVVVFLLVLAAAAAALAWHLCWRLTGDAGAAWFGWAAVSLSVPVVFQAPSVYPDLVGGLCVLIGVWVIVRPGSDPGRPDGRGLTPVGWLAHGAAIAYLPWLHTRFAILAGVLGALSLARLLRPLRIRAIAAFLAVPVVSAVAWLGFFLSLYGSPNPMAPYGTATATSVHYVLDGVAGLLADQRFGLLTYAPVLACAIAGFVAMARGGRLRLAVELLLVIVPYTLAVCSYRMWWAGWSAPARFFVAVLPLLALPCAAAWAAIASRSARILATGALVMTITSTAIVVWVDRGRLAFNSRTTPGLYERWLTRNTDLSNGLPLWTEDGRQLFVAVAAWTICLAAAWIALRALERHPRLAARGRLAACGGGLFAAAAMAALSLTWTATGASGRDASETQFSLLRAVADSPGQMAIALPALQRIPLAAIPRELRIQLRTAPDADSHDWTVLAVAGHVPAGDYAVSIVTRGVGGQVTIGGDNPDAPLARLPVSPAAAPTQISLPVDLYALVVRGDQDAARRVTAVTLEPTMVRATSARVSAGTARDVRRYGRAAIFFLDDRSFPEPGAFWIGGARETAFVVQGTEPVTLRLRNAPAANRVTIDAGADHHELTMAPGEEQDIVVHVDPRTPAALVRLVTSAGFRPSDADPSNRDRRYLGVYVNVE